MNSTSANARVSIDGRGALRPQIAPAPATVATLARGAITRFVRATNANGRRESTVSVRWIRTGWACHSNVTPLNVPADCTREDHRDELAIPLSQAPTSFGRGQQDVGGNAPVTRRRDLIAAGLATAAATIAIGAYAEPALAHDPDDVALGGVNPATLPTYISRANGGSVLYLDSTGGYGTGLTATGTAYGVSGTGTYAGVVGNTTITDGAGVSGVAGTDGASGVSGVSGSSQGATGTGVLGTCSKGYGVFAATGPAFNIARQPGPVAVYGQVRDDVGLAGVFEGGRAALRLVPRHTAGAPTTGAHNPGELIVDSNGVLFYCRSAGTPGTWIRVDASPVIPTIPTEPTVPVLNILPTPERFVDTRTGLGGVQGPVPAETTRTFAMTGRLGEAADPTLQIPDSATMLVGNLTAIGADGVPLGSFATLWPGGPLPNMYNHAPCDYILDVTGYYTTS